MKKLKGSMRREAEQKEARVMFVLVAASQNPTNIFTASRRRHTSRCMTQYFEDVIENPKHGHTDS